MPVEQITFSNETARHPAAPCGVGVGRVVAWLAKEYVRGLGAVNLSPAQYRALVLLVSGPSLSSTLAGQLGVSAPSVSALVDGLVGRRLVERRHSENDRRRVTLTLTAKGEDLLDRADRALDAHFAAAAETLSDAGAVATAYEGLGLWGEAITALRLASKGAREAESPEEARA